VATCFLYTVKKYITAPKGAVKKAKIDQGIFAPNEKSQLNMQ
jgi:hypothetical protein